jgi:WD40 repeat protein
VADDPRLNRAVEEYLAALQAGVPPDRQAFLAAHAEIAAALAECLDGLDFIQAAAPQLRQSGSEAVSAKLQGRLERGLACLKLLRQVLPEQPDTPTSTDAPTADTAPPPSNLGRFQLRRELGHGAFGIVFLAHDPHLRRDVALKVPRAEALVDPAARQRFLREARAAAGLDHPNVVPVYEAGEADAVCYIASAYCPGATLAQWLKQRDEPVPARQAAALVATLAEAVEHAHSRGVVHRDLKPGNVLLAVGHVSNVPGAEGTLETCPTFGIPKITDFGLAKLLEGEPGASATGAQTESGAIVGTPCYMAPEQAGGHSKEVGPAADIYALGAILYEVLAGRPPFQGETALDTLLQVRIQEPIPPRSLRPQLPRDLETICLKCLQKAPAKRYATAQALADDLRRFLADEPVQARPVGRVERLWRWCGRHPAVAVSVALAAALVVGLPTSFAISEALNADRLRQEQENTKGEQKKTEEALAKTHWEAADLALDRGLNLFTQGEGGRGLLWLVRSLEHAVQANDAERERAVRATLVGWRREVHTLQMRLPTRTGAGLRKVAFSPDGKTVAIADGLTARLWQTTTGEPVGPPLQHRGEVRAVAFSPDGKALLTGSQDGTARLWDTATGQPLISPCAHPGHAGYAGVYAVAFSSDGKTFLTGSGGIRRWDAATGKLLGSQETAPKYHAIGEFSRDGKFLVTADGSVAQQWEVSKGPRGAPLQHPEGQSWIRAAAFSPDGETILTGSQDGTLRLWEAATGKPRGQPVPYASPIHAVAFGPDGKAFLAGAEDGTARLWDAGTRLPIGQPLQHDKHSAVEWVAFSPDGKTLLTRGSDQTVRLWATARGQGIGSPLPHGSSVSAVAFSPDGRVLLTGSWGSEARLWDTATGQPLTAPFDLEPAGRVFAVAFSPDGKTFLTGSGDQGGRAGIVNPGAWGVGGGKPKVRLWFGQARLWETATGKLAAPAMKHDGAVVAVAFGADGKTLLTVGEDGCLRVWDAATGALRRELPRQPVPTQSSWVATFSPDGKTLLTDDLTDDQRQEGPDEDPRTYRENVSKTFLKGAQLWDVATGKPRGQPLRPPQGFSAWAFSPDSQTVLTGGLDRTARLWRTATGEPLGLSIHLQGECRAVAFSADGKTILTGSSDGTARRWDAVTGAPLGPPLPHRGAVCAVAFSPAGRALLTVCDFWGGETEGRLWATATGKPLGPPLRLADRFRWPGGSSVQALAAFSPDGKVVLTGDQDKLSRLWSVPAPIPGEPERITVWAQVITGLELDQYEEISVLDADTWQQRRQHLEALGGPPLP